MGKRIARINLLVLLLGSFVICRSAELATVSSDNVLVRKSPYSNEVLVSLKKGSQINVTSVSTDFVVFKGYVGRWAKIVVNGIEGYMLDCFIESLYVKSKPFHIFIDDFMRKIKSGDIPYDSIVYPLSYKYSGAVDQSSDDKMYKDHLIMKTDILKKYFLFAISDSLKERDISIKDGKIKISYCKDAYCVTYIFDFIDSNWKLVGINISNY